VVIGYHLVKLNLVAFPIRYQPVKAVYLDSFGTLTIQVFSFAFMALLLATPPAISAVNPLELLSPVLGNIVTGYPD